MIRPKDEGSYDEEDFAKKFTGICLLLEPSADFKPTNELPPSNLQIFWPYVAKNISEYIYLCLTSGILVCLGLFLPFLVKNFFDNVVTGDISQNLSHSFLIASVGILLVSFGFTYLNKVILARLEMKISLTEARHIISHTLKLPLKFFKQRYPGDLSQRLSSIESLSLLIGFAPVMVFLSLLSIGAYGIAMFFYSSFMATIVFVFAFLYVFAFSKLSKKMTEQSKRMGNDLGISYGWSADAIHVMDTIKANGSTSFLFERCIGYMNKVIRAYSEMIISSNIVGILPMLTLSLFTAFIYGYGGWSFSQGHMGLGEVLAFQMLSLNFLQPISNLIFSGSRLAQSRSSFDRINDIIHHETDPYHLESNQEKQEEVRKKIRSRPGKTLSGHVELRQVTFGYDKEKEPLIKDLSLTIQPKQRVVLLGKSGSGKSTLVQLFCGLMEPWSGKILFDGEELKSIPKDILAQSLSYVNQDIALFEGTSS